MILDLASLCQDFCRLSLTFAEDPFFVYVMPPKTARLTKTSFHSILTVNLGRDLSVLGTAEMGGQTVEFFGLQKTRGAYCRFKELAEKAGAFVPARVLDESQMRNPSSFAARWLIAMWSGLPPSSGITVPDRKGKPFCEDGFDGWTWLSPFLDAYVAAERLGLATEVAAADREPEPPTLEIWSKTALTKSEIARRLLGRNARPRDVDKFFDSLEKRMVPGTNKFFVRLDTLPAPIRQHLSK